jgi:hypothetical protein
MPPLAWPGDATPNLFGHSLFHTTPGPNKAGVPPSGLSGGPSAIITGSDYTAEISWPTQNTESSTSSNANGNTVTGVNTRIE